MMVQLETGDISLGMLPYSFTRGRKGRHSTSLFHFELATYIAGIKVVAKSTSKDNIFVSNVS